MRHGATCSRSFAPTWRSFRKLSSRRSTWAGVTICLLGPNVAAGTAVLVRELEVYVAPTVAVTRTPTQ
jgi:hypothetical protein